jgi:capsular exopolysaccharide synthesis family protein
MASMDKHELEPEGKEPQGAPDALPAGARASALVARRRTNRLRPPTSIAPGAGELLRTLRYRWQLALVLGLIAGFTAALITYLVMPKSKEYYGSVAELQIRGTPFTGQGDLNYGVYRRTLLDLLRSRALAEAAVQSEKAKELAVIAKNPEDAVRLLQSEDFALQSGGQETASQLVRISLIAPDANEPAVLLNAVSQTFIDQVAENEKQQRDQRHSFLTKAHKDIQDQMKAQHEQLETKREAVKPDLENRARAAEQRYQYMEKDLTAQGMELMRKEIRLQNALKGASTAPAFNIEANVERALLLDRSLQMLDNRARLIQSKMIDYEKLAANPRDDPNYRDYEEELKTLQAMKVKRTDDLRGQYRKRLFDISQRPKQSLEADKAEFEEDKKQFEVLAEQAKAAFKEWTDAAAAYRKENGRVMDDLGQVEQKMVQLDKQDKIITDQLAPLEAQLEQGPSVAVLNWASVPEPVLEKNKSSTVRYVLMAGLGMFALALIGVGFWEFRSRRIHTPDEAAGHLGLRILGVIPQLPEQVLHQPVPLYGTEDAYWQSRLTEAIDSITAMLLHETEAIGARVLMITSAVGQEGKTTLASHLAASLARAGKRTLLIDGDLVHPSVHQMFGEQVEPGLSDLLRGQAALADVIRPTQASGLWIIPTGHVDAQVQQALARDAVQPFLERLKAEYDMVLLDSSPVLPLAHSLNLGKHVDAAIFAIRRDVSKMMPVYAAYQRLGMLGIPVLGGVFSGSDNAAFYSYLYNPALHQTMQLSA